MPVLSSSDVALIRARTLYGRGRLAEALQALDRVDDWSAVRPDADALRVEIQRLLLASGGQKHGGYACDVPSVTTSSFEPEPRCKNCGYDLSFGADELVVTAGRAGRRRHLGSGFADSRHAGPTPFAASSPAVTLGRRRGCAAAEAARTGPGCRDACPRACASAGGVQAAGRRHDGVAVVRTGRSRCGAGPASRSISKPTSRSCSCRARSAAAAGGSSSHARRPGGVREKYQRDLLEPAEPARAAGRRGDLAPPAIPPPSGRRRRPRPTRPRVPGGAGRRRVRRSAVRRRDQPGGRVADAAAVRPDARPNRCAPDRAGRGVSVPARQWATC